MVLKMAIYQIDYDLQDPGQSYEDLYKAIMNLGDYIHILESTWIVGVSDYTASEIRDNLKKHIDSNDKLLVTKLSGGWATTFSNSDTDWLHEHL